MLPLPPYFPLKVLPQYDCTVSAVVGARRHEHGASKQGRSSGAGGSGALCDDKPQLPFPSPGSLRGFTHLDDVFGLVLHVRGQLLVERPIVRQSCQRLRYVGRRACLGGGRG